MQYGVIIFDAAWGIFNLVTWQHWLNQSRRLRNKKKTSKMNDAHYELSKMKDFLSIYNKMAENCFSRCINTFNYRNLTEEEFKCIDRCAEKNINTNHRIMQVYIEIQPEILNKRYEESEKIAAQQQAINS